MLDLKINILTEFDCIRNVRKCDGGFTSDASADTTNNLMTLRFPY